MLRFTREKGQKIKREEYNTIKARFKKIDIIFICQTKRTKVPWDMLEKLLKKNHFLQEEDSNSEEGNK